MSYVAAVTQLAGLSVVGITTSLNITERKGALGPAALPALVPDFEVSLSNTFKQIDFSGQSGVATLALNHILLSSGLGLGSASERIGDMVALVDNYFAAIKGDLLLNDNLAEPLQIVFQNPGPIVYYGTGYYGMVFTHLWKLIL